MRKNLVLLGMMAVGKTTFGKIVAKTQNLEFIDTDMIVENKNSMTIKEIFEKKGEKFFREEEEKEVPKLLNKSNCVIALGGGAFMNKNIRESVLKNSLSVWLSISQATLNKRLKWNEKRPLLKKNNNAEKISELYKQRKKIYKLANYKIECDKLTKQDIVKKIIELYENQ